ncbi:5'-nucleotidase SurE [Desulfovibrionales bacterium]
MHLLLTNDDGIQAVGLRAMYAALLEDGHRVSVVAPITEQSAVGHAVTVASPLRVKEFRETDFHGYGVSGTPVDCVKMALTALLPDTPDLVVSGINAGSNVGVDLLYSGTVSAATEAAFFGLKAIAVSHDDFNPKHLAGHAAYVTVIIAYIPWATLPEQCVMNLNFPACPVEEAKPLVLCRHTRAMYNDTYDQRIDSRGRAYYWLTGSISVDQISPDTDRALLSAGHITLTPLCFDFTDHDTLARLADYRLGS